MQLTEARQSSLIPLCAAAHKRPPKQIILDIDATDDPLHGNQEGSFFNANYDSYCDLPLYIFCDRHLPVAKLRPADTGAAAGTAEPGEPSPELV